MRRIASDDDDRGAPQSMVERIERAAEFLNPFLIVLAIGLALLDFTCLGLMFSHYPIGRAAVDHSASGPVLPAYGVLAPGPKSGGTELHSGLDLK